MMIKLGLYEKLDLTDKDVKGCLDALLKAEIINSENILILPGVSSLLKNDIINPIYLKTVLKNKENQKLANLLIISLGIFLIPESLRYVISDDENLK